MTRREILKSTSLFLGYSVTAGAFAQIFTACQNEPKGGSGKGQFFNAEQLELLGEIPSDTAVRDSVLRRQLLVEMMPGCPASLAIGNLAGKLIG